MIEANHLFHKISALTLPDVLLAIAFPYYLTFCNCCFADTFNSLSPLVWFFRIYAAQGVLWGRTSCRASPNPLAWVTRKGRPADNVSKAVTPNPSDLEGIKARSAVDSTVARSSRFARNGSQSTAFSWSRFHLVQPQRRAGNLCHSVEWLLRPQCRNPWVQNLLSRPVPTTEHCTSYLDSEKLSLTRIIQKRCLA